ncbi:MAG: hypothetical protein JW880_01245 [Candidatus Thermoplasmatota archaeon]|nr:hypothetical protein [Candidatus Thermoplasmatota archaeon]
MVPRQMFRHAEIPKGAIRTTKMTIEASPETFGPGYDEAHAVLCNMVKCRN